jgi:regulator of protease activity HflC (stomatin/prohibitin superfamily)
MTICAEGVIMLGIRFIKFESTVYVIHYKNGSVKKEGPGLSFYYYAPTSSIAAVPAGSNDLPFIFSETTADFQTVSIQGSLTFKVTDPRKLASLLDFTVGPEGGYIKNDYEKLSQRLINEAQTSASAFVQGLTIRDSLRSAKRIERVIAEGLHASTAVALVGIEILSVNILAVTPTPEMARALEAQAREGLQQEADEAIYARRNFAVEQERKIKESELNTEIAVEEKKKQIAAKRMEAEIAVEENRRRLREIKVGADIAIEEKRSSLIDTQGTNQRKEADTRGYAMTTMLAPYRDVDWKVLMAIGREGQDPRLNIALAFRELAEHAQKIGALNITPDLLENVMAGREPQKEKSR